MVQKSSKTTCMGESLQLSVTTSHYSTFGRRTWLSPRLPGMLRSIADYDYVLQHRPGKMTVLPDALTHLSGADWSEVTDGQTGILLQRETKADDAMRELMTLV